MTRIVRGSITGIAMSLLLSCPVQELNGQTPSAKQGASGNRLPAAPRRGAQSGIPVQSAIVVVGNVVMDDGGPAPTSTVVERVCFGRSRKEANVGADGSFGFRVGANNVVVGDATDSARPDPSGSGSSQFSGGSMRADPSPWAGITGCELRAVLSGYRSSVIYLKGGETVGQVNVGTMVLQPQSRITGTTVSLTTLQAPKAAKKEFEQAEKELRQNRIDQAEKRLQAAVAGFPRFAEAWFALGLIHEQHHRVDDARSMFGRALEADGKFVSPYVELARLAGVERKWQEVVDLTDRALALNPLDIPEALYFNALANFNLFRLEAAELSATKAQRLDTQHKYPNSYLLLAEILRLRQDHAGEAEQLRSFLLYAPLAAAADGARARLEELERVAGPLARREP
jgi:tetratricopeptide (TPR) repeat protein